MSAADVMMAGLDATAESQKIALDFGDALRIADVLRNERHHDEAECLYRRILEAKPGQPDALRGLGMIAQQRGDHAGALSWLRQAVVAAPSQPGAYDPLGVSLAALGYFDEALLAYSKAAALDPGDAAAHAHLAAALKEEGWLQEAVDAYRTALALAPDRTELYTDLGWVLYRLGRTVESADVYRRWLAVEPASAVARHLLAARSGENVPARADSDYVQRLFDGYAERFDESLRALDYRVPGMIAAAIAVHLGEPGGRLMVLDAGCGTGLCGPLLRPYACELVGVDLSPRMLDKARERGVYERLIRAELTAYLGGLVSVYDLIASADTLVYFGDLGPVLAAARNALRAGGWLVFTVELAEAARIVGYDLEPHGRYSHTGAYVETELSAEGLELQALEVVQLRLEVGAWVRGALVVARKPPV